MFDPHHIGPQRTSSYARNKGRVIQRRLVDTPSPGYTRSELEQLVPLMRKNGFIPTVPSTDFGRVVEYKVFVDNIDITSQYYEPVNGFPFEFTVGWYLAVNPGLNLPTSTDPQLGFKVFGINEDGNYTLDGVHTGCRIYALGSGSYDLSDRVEMRGANGTYVTMHLLTRELDYGPGETISFVQNMVTFDM